MDIITPLLWIFGGIGIFIFLCWFGDECSNCSHFSTIRLKEDKFTTLRCLKIKFKTFLNWYTLSPETWEIGEDYIYKKISAQEHQYINFGLFGYWGYSLWKRAQKIDKIKTENRQLTIKLLEQVQREIKTKI